MTLARLAVLPLAATLALLDADATAQSIDDARSAHEDGRFLQAADLGEALGTSGGYALAAHSLALYAHYEAESDEWSEVVERAMRMGEEAVRAAPASPEAHCHLAHAVARYAQRVSTLTVLRKNLAGKIRDSLEAALEIDPDHAMAHLMLGIWHTDVAAAGSLRDGSTVPTGKTPSTTTSARWNWRRSPRSCCTSTASVCRDSTRREAPSAPGRCWRRRSDYRCGTGTRSMSIWTYWTDWSRWRANSATPLLFQQALDDLDLGRPAERRNLMELPLYGCSGSTLLPSGRRPAPSNPNSSNAIRKELQ